MRPARLSRLVLASPVLLALALAACGTSVPLPPMPPLKPLPPITLSPPAAASAPAGFGAPEVSPFTPATPSPVQMPPVESGMAPAPGTPPYGDAVSARFPDPAASYFTPAFEQGHAGYTSNAELHAFMQSLANRSSSGASIRYLGIGYSQQGQPLDAVLFSSAPDTTSTGLQAAGRPTVLLMGQQHGDEPAGAEALIVLAQRLAGPELRSVLDRINVILVPRVNPDGADKGLRLSANGIDIDRDHLDLRTPEAQAIAGLMNEYRPMVVVDAREYPAVRGWVEKFGALPSYDVLMQYAMTPNLPEFVTKASEEWFRRPMLAAFKRENLSSQWYFTASSDPSDRRLSMGDVEPDSARNVDGLRNAVSLLVGSRGSDIGRLHLKRRVYSQLVAMTSVLHSAAGRAADLVKLRAYLDADVASKVCQGEAVIEAAETPSEYHLTMLDPATGADRPMTVSWESSLEFDVMRKRSRPCGYWISADAIDAVSRLRSLGATVQQVQEPGVVQADSYTEEPRRDAAVPVPGASPAARITLKSALMDVPSGSYYVGLDQPLGSLVMAAMEPDAPASYLSHGLTPRLDQMARVTMPPNLKFAAIP